MAASAGGEKPELLGDPSFLDATGTAKKPLPKEKKFKYFERVGFALYSTHRISPTRFVFCGLGGGKNGKALRSAPKRCIWTKTADGSSTEGSVQLLHSHWHRQGPFVNTVIFCHFNESASLSLNGVASGATKTEASSGEMETTPPGHLQLEIGPEQLTRFIQTQNLKAYRITFRGPFPLTLVHCGAPLFERDIQPRAVLQWLQYHAALGFQHFSLYDAGGMTPELRALLDPFLAAKLADVTPFREQENFKSDFHGRDLAFSDCMFRYSNVATWVANIEMEDYLTVPDKILPTLESWFDVRAKEGYTELSIGNYDYAPYCNEDLWAVAQPKFAVEKIVFRAKEPTCSGAESRKRPDFCAMHFGKRKLFVNPRQVLLSGMHTVLAGLNSKAANLPVSTSIHFGHFHGLLSRKACHRIVQLGTYVQSFNITNFALRVRECTKTSVIPTTECTLMRH